MPLDIKNTDSLPKRSAGFRISWVLEMCIMAYLHHKDAYGYELSQSKAIQVSESTIYPILRRLLADGYLDAYTQQHNGKLRKFYRITAKGDDRLNDLKNRWHEFAQNVNGLL